LAFIVASVSALLGAASLLELRVAEAAEAAEDLPVGATAVVNGTDGSGLRMRSGPGLSHKVLTVLAEGDRVLVLDGPVSESAQDWYQVKTDAAKGWALGKYLISADRGLRSASLGPGGTGRTFSAKISTYSAGDPGVGNFTDTVTQVRLGTVAVDPRFISFGSQITIEGFDGMLFTAEDRGGGVIGPHVDVYIPDRAAFGPFNTQMRKVTVLREGYGSQTPAKL